MSVSAAKGSFGIGLQTNRGTAAGTINYIKASSVNVNMDQQANPLGAEVGGSMWASGSFKTGVSVGGDAAFNVRADSIGWLLKAFSGSASASGPAAGVYSHSFFENDDPGFIPYVTLVKNISDMWTEQFVDCRVDTLRLDVPAAGIVTATVGFVGIMPKQIDNPVEVFDNSPLFETCVGEVSFNNDSTFKTTRVSFDFSNNLSRDERIVGSYYLDDVTMVRRTCRITCDTFLKDPTWYRQVYRFGDSANGAAFNPRVFSAALDVVIETARPVAGTATGKIRIHIPNMDYLAFPVSLAGNDILRVSLSAEVTITGSDRAFFIEVDNGLASYPTT